MNHFLVDNSFHYPPTSFDIGGACGEENPSSFIGNARVTLYEPRKIPDKNVPTYALVLGLYHTADMGPLKPLIERLSEHNRLVIIQFPGITDAQTGQGSFMLDGSTPTLADAEQIVLRALIEVVPRWSELKLITHSAAGALFRPNSDEGNIPEELGLAEVSSLDRLKAFLKKTMNINLSFTLALNPAPGAQDRQGGTEFNNGFVWDNLLPSLNPFAWSEMRLDEEEASHYFANRMPNSPETSRYVGDASRMRYAHHALNFIDLTLRLNGSDLFREALTRPDFAVFVSSEDHALPTLNCDDMKDLHRIRCLEGSHMAAFTPEGANEVMAVLEEDEPATLDLESLSEIQDRLYQHLSGNFSAGASLVFENGEKPITRLIPAALSLQYGLKRLGTMGLAWNSTLAASVGLREGQFGAILGGHLASGLRLEAPGLINIAGRSPDLWVELSPANLEVFTGPLKEDFPHNDTVLELGALLSAGVNVTNIVSLGVRWNPLNWIGMETHLTRTEVFMHLNF